MSEDPFAGPAGLARWAEEMQQKAERFQTLQGRMARLSVTEISADKSVQVTIDNNGIPTDIRFGAEIRRKNPAALSAEVMSCLNRARQRLVDQVAATVHETVGDDPIGANILDKFPKPPAAADPGSWAPPATADPAQPHSAPAWNDPAPIRSDPAGGVPGTTRPGPRPPAPPAEPPPPPRHTAATPANPGSLIPDVEDEETEYYRNKSWLV
ncbi:YbaB/EbfC family nucleoid-associated protein [Nocardia speluncae]|uniref:YbaB/EbfC family nucleoid-associated protein n=1 Tax=Nocardia speluncae TaxID=419477 RepID=A0A846XFB0_9NOCA|nr:YbaB/EbfC family nucleoid-associated protein [Nocardia speluncae]NKY34642.1 YbaB/EbfC family nucleoid-associated protein [Nocardia speluncae]